MSGFYEGTDLANKTFYGFRLDQDTGNLTVEALTGDVPVVLPQPGIIDKTDYKQWIWSRDTLHFQFNDKGHLQVKFL